MNEENTMPNDNPATPATKKAMEEFMDAFLKGLARERAELDAMPKVHDPSKGEYVREVDPKLMDR
jgi:hypothetical protein